MVRTLLLAASLLPLSDTAFAQVRIRAPWTAVDVGPGIRVRAPFVNLNIDPATNRVLRSGGYFDAATSRIERHPYYGYPLWIDSGIPHFHNYWSANRYFDDYERYMWSRYYHGQMRLRQRIQVQPMPNPKVSRHTR